jgi:hypothetical protein
MPNFIRIAPFLPVAESVKIGRYARVSEDSSAHRIGCSEADLAAIASPPAILWLVPAVNNAAEWPNPPWSAATPLFPLPAWLYTTGYSAELSAGRPDRLRQDMGQRILRQIAGTKVRIAAALPAGQFPSAGQDPSGREFATLPDGGWPGQRQDQLPW